MTRREQEILEIIKDNPLISQRELAERLGIQRSTAAGCIMGLTRAGIIRGRGYLLNEPESIVVVGGANMDIQGYPLGSFRERDSNPGRVRVSAGGVARNTAENLARLGFNVTLLTALGDDHNGRLIRELSGKAGICMARVRTVGGVPSATYLSLMDETGDLAGAVADMEISREITPEYVMDNRELIKQARIIILDANLPVSTIEILAEGFPDIPLFADPVSAVKAERFREILPKLHTLKPNRLEAEALLGRAIQGRSGALHAVESFLEMGIRQVFLSLGAGGLAYGSADGVDWLSPPEIPDGVRKGDSRGNATGAGDAFLAGVAAAWMRGGSCSEAAWTGIRAAQLTLGSNEAVFPAMTWEKIEGVKL